MVNIKVRGVGLTRQLLGQAELVVPVPEVPYPSAFSICMLRLEEIWCFGPML